MPFSSLLRTMLPEPTSTLSGLRLSEVGHLTELGARARSPWTLLGIGLLRGLTKNIEEAEKGRTEEAKLLGYLMGLAPELPEELRNQIPSAARLSDVMGGFRLSGTPRIDLDRRLSQFALPRQEENQRFREPIELP